MLSEYKCVGITCISSIYSPSDVHLSNGDEEEEDYDDDDDDD